MLAGTSAIYFSIPIAIAIVGLLLIVVISYRQTIHEYPNGGGAYIVAKENLGELAGLTAGAALLIDYVLTVSVSVAAGIAAITSAFPFLYAHNILLCVLSILILTIANLRGLRESSTIFAFPTYAFILGILVLIATGCYQFWSGSPVQPHPSLKVQAPFTLFLLLRAFSSGCTAMTGVEAVSNGVPAFKLPESKNASITLIIMASILTVMFLGITFLSYYHGIVPLSEETVVSQLARSVFGSNFFYYFVQFTTMGILILAANTSFADFPRLASLLARDRYLPRQLASLGDRLVFSNGILMLGLMSVLIIVLFKAHTHAIIPLYAVGVFLSFTLSQSGMVKHWHKDRKPGWLKHAVVNAFGAFLTAIVTIIFVVTKFVDGAWIITVLIPGMIWLFFEINEHYLSVGKQLSLTGFHPNQLDWDRKLKHTVLLPISGIHKGVIEALKYAESIAEDVRAVYVEINPEMTQKLREEWREWGRGTQLVVLQSAYRSVLTPFLSYVNEVDKIEHDDVITVIIPEFVTARWWQNLLHNQTALLLRASLLFKRGTVVTSVRYHLD